MRRQQWRSLARHDESLDIAKAAVSGNVVELRTDLDLPRRLDRVAIDCLKVEFTGRKQGRHEVAIVGDGNIVSARIDATREVVANECRPESPHSTAVSVEL